MAVVTVCPLASTADFAEFGSNQELVQNEDRWNGIALDRLMRRSTASIESRCQRRFAPFTGLVETFRAVGVDNAFMVGNAFPLDLSGAMGRSQARAYSATNMIHDFWLEQRPPTYQDSWTYTLESVQLLRPFNDAEHVDISQCQGPDLDTGHVRFNLGIFAPESTTVTFTYGGGYDPIPDDLNLACIFQAIEFVLIGAEPETRGGMSRGDLEEDIVRLLGPYAKY